MIFSVYRRVRNLVTKTECIAWSDAVKTMRIVERSDYRWREKCMCILSGRNANHSVFVPLTTRLYVYIFFLFQMCVAIRSATESLVDSRHWPDHVRGSSGILNWSRSQLVYRSDAICDSMHSPTVFRLPQWRPRDSFVRIGLTFWLRLYNIFVRSYRFSVP